MWKGNTPSAVSHRKEQKRWLSLSLSVSDRHVSHQPVTFAGVTGLSFSEPVAHFLSHKKTPFFLFLNNRRKIHPILPYKKFNLSSLSFFPLWYLSPSTLRHPLILCRFSFYLLYISYTLWFVPFFFLFFSSGVVYI